MRKLFSLFSVFVLLSQTLVAQDLVVKLNAENKLLSDGKSKKAARYYSFIKRLGCLESRPILQKAKSGSFLEGYQVMKFNKGITLEELMESLKQSGYFESVEATDGNVVTPLHIPNDPFADPQTGSQDYLGRINAYKAWDVSKGDTNTFICFIDNGLEWTHPEFVGKIKYNKSDPIDSVDNDLDGYADNYMGWDFANNDPFPEDSTGAVAHGTEAAGVAVANTNNGLGMASVGYNIKIMPIKIFGGNISNYQQFYSIVYAAEMGCKVINLSWGGVYNYTQYEQDMINYAVLEKDAVIVAATFPTEGEYFTYPADYENVMSVAGLYVDDTKAYPQSYHYWVDMSVPSINIFTTRLKGGYAYPSGISVGIPMVSATAALVRERFPLLNATQVQEKIRVSSVNVDTVKTNHQFKEKLGFGKLDVYRALTDTVLPAVRIKEYDLTQINGDTFALSLGCKNYLWTSEYLNLTLRQMGADFELLDTVAAIGHLGMLDSVGSPVLKLRILPYQSNRRYALMRIGIMDSSLRYFDYQYFYLDKSAYTSVITATEEVQVEDAIGKAFPNPFADVLFVEGQEGQTVEILDMLGQVQMKSNQGAELVSFNTSTLTSGIYMLRSTSSKEARSQKVIKK
jgi:serine protease